MATGRKSKTSSSRRAEGQAQLARDLKKVQSQLQEQISVNQALNERVLELYTLYNVSRTLSMTLQLNELFDLSMNVLAETLNLNQFCLMLLDESTGKLVIQASHGMPQEIGKPGMACMEDGISWKVARGGKAVLINDISQEKKFFYFKGSKIREGSYLGVPLMKRDGQVLGVLNAHKSRAHAFKDADLRLFESVAEHVAIAIDNALIYKQTRELMHRDELTNLYNRRYFFERFDREIYRADRYHHPISLLMVDIDHFKLINDAHGHLAGDAALRRLARILEKRLRKADLLARYGGEEFLALLPETNKKGALCVAEKLRAEVERTDFAADLGASQPVHFTVTIGVASMPQDTENGKTLLDLADKALYFGKARGRNQVCAQIPSEKDLPSTE
jgi:diguanylate cyclase (GGDEF)-like protein